jgi:predicted MFS family arabinose efflux permease
MAGLLAGHSFLLLFVGDAGSTFLFGLIIALTIPETRPKGPSTETVGRGVSPLRDPVLLVFCLLMSITGVTFFQCFSTLPLVMARDGLSPKQYGLVIAVNGILISVLQPLVTRWIEGRPRAPLLSLSALLIGAGYGFMRFCHTPLQYAGSIAIWTLGEMTQSPVASAVIADLAPEDSRGSYQGVYMMSWSIAFMAAPMLGTTVLARWGVGSLSTMLMGFGLLASLGHLGLGRARRRRMMAVGLPESA